MKYIQTSSLSDESNSLLLPLYSEASFFCAKTTIIYAVFYPHRTALEINASPKFSLFINESFSRQSLCDPPYKSQYIAVIYTSALFCAYGFYFIRFLRITGITPRNIRFCIIPILFYLMNAVASESKTPCSFIFATYSFA